MVQNKQSPLPNGGRGLRKMLNTIIKYHIESEFFIRSPPNTKFPSIESV